jgi:hypothetical protein
MRWREQGSFASQCSRGQTLNIHVTVPFVVSRPIDRHCDAVTSQHFPFSPQENRHWHKNSRRNPSSGLLRCGSHSYAGACHRATVG